MGIQSSSRAAGRVAIASLPPEPLPAEPPGPMAGRPRSSSTRFAPGAMADSSTSKRSTAKRDGAAGSAPTPRGGPLAAGDALPLAPVRGDADAPAFEEPEGPCDAAGERIGVAV